MAAWENGTEFPGNSLTDMEVLRHTPDQLIVKLQPLRQVWVAGWILLATGISIALYGGLLQQAQDTNDGILGFLVGLPAIGLGIVQLLRYQTETCTLDKQSGYFTLQQRNLFHSRTLTGNLTDIQDIRLQQLPGHEINEIRYIPTLVTNHYTVRLCQYGIESLEPIHQMRQFLNLPSPSSTP